MGLDDDADADLHMWRLETVVLAPGEQSGSEYRCELCGTLLVVPAGGVPPGTV